MSSDTPTPPSLPSEEGFVTLTAVPPQPQSSCPAHTSQPRPQEPPLPLPKLPRLTEMRGQHGTFSAGLCLSQSLPHLSGLYTQTTSARPRALPLLFTLHPGVPPTSGTLAHGSHLGERGKMTWEDSCYPKSLQIVIHLTPDLSACPSCPRARTSQYPGGSKPQLQL